MLSVTETIGALAASTMRNFKDVIADNIIADHIYTSMLGNPDIAPKLFKARKLPGQRVASGIKFEESPGRSLEYPIDFRKNSNTEHFSGFETLKIAKQDNQTRVTYDWGRLASSISISNEDIDKNGGSKWKIYDLVEAEMNNMKATLSEDMNRALLGVRTKSSEPFGLIDIIPDGAGDPTFASLGGLPVATNTFWVNQQINHGGGSFGTDQTGDGMKNLRRLKRQCMFGSEHPQVFLAGDDAYESVINSMVSQQRYNKFEARGSQAIADAGFEVVTVEGLPLVLERLMDDIRSDNSLNGDAIYALNLNFLKIGAMKRRWFEPSREKEPVDQDITVVHNITGYNHWTNGRRYQGVLHNIPTP